ncbi:MAG: hypothetical protein ISS74_05000 [Planctomycetes bacterium]|nr:hypothetical protein [Planctomycetota bacterium]
MPDTFGSPGRLCLIPRRILFAGSQDHRFDQDVEVHVSWRQDDPRPPPGDYGGRVTLTAMLMP